MRGKSGVGGVEGRTVRFLDANSRGRRAGVGGI